MKRINNRPVAVEAVLTRCGTVVVPLMSELTGHAELTPYRGGWCGNEMFPEVLTGDLSVRAAALVRRLRDRLGVEGYRGFFEVDVLVDVDTDEVYLGELNPRLSGASSITNVTAGAYADVPLFLFHLLEYSPVELDLDLDDINQRLAGACRGRPLVSDDHRSSETDVLGWVCEAAAGLRMPKLMLSQVVWSILGAETDARIAVDSAGSGMYDGGICATRRDLARFGTMLAHGGTSLSGHQVVPRAWITDTFRGDRLPRRLRGQPHPDVDARGDAPQPVLAALPRPRRTPVSRHPRTNALRQRGHGRRRRQAASWPEPQHAWKLFATLRAFDAVSSQLAQISDGDSAIAVR
jgi:hypothetical protein